MTSLRPRSGDPWKPYLDWFHKQRPGITEEILASAADDSRGSPYEWFLDVDRRDGMALDVACGSGPLQLIGCGHRRVGIDRSTDELAKAGERIRSPLVRGDTDHLPFPDDAFDLVACSMALMLFDPVDVVLTQIRRVLRQSGTAVFLLPGSFPLSARDRFRYIRMLVALHQTRPAYPNRVHLSRLPGYLERAGFEILQDDRRRFTHLLPDAYAARRFVESLYAPSHSSRQIEAAVRIVHRWVGSDIGIPLRRVVCGRKIT